MLQNQPAIASAEYVRLLQQPGPGGCFWGPAGKCLPPVYPGSVALAHAIGQVHGWQWILGESNSTDRNLLLRLIPTATVAPSLLSPPTQVVADAVRARLNPGAFVLVDPSASRPEGVMLDGRTQNARAFIVHCARQGAVVMAWYGLHGPNTQNVIQSQVWKPLATGSLQPSGRLKVELRWLSPGRSVQQMTGVGLIMANLQTQTALHMGGLARALGPLYGTDIKTWS